MRNGFLALMALYAAACASSTAPPPPSLVPTGATTVSTAQADADAFRADLEQAYADIVSRSGEDASDYAAIADVEAAASMPVPEHRTIASAVRLFSGNMKESIQRSLHRSTRYRKLIDETLAAEKLPKGLAYLPVIESAFVPTLTSRAGAHGLWQFMPATAREYGLRVDWWIDERADPELSTRAAATYLKDLYRMFGDWSLALAAYNCGPGRLRRTMNASGATTFWELVEQGLLPKETRGYVPTFWATLLIASDPEGYGMTLGKPEARDESTVELRGPVSLAYIAETIGVDEEILRDLNPALRRGVVPPGRASVRVPRRAAPLLAARADSLRDDDATIQFCSFRLRKGDSIERIARAIGTDAATIVAMNGLQSEKSAGTGDAIYLPVRARELGALLAHSRDREIFYAVKKGDTLYSIAKRNGLSVAELRELNEMRGGEVLRVGQKLRISAPRAMSAGGM